jgi:DNA-directed RNA polymerase specialized sigma24 family protein
VKRVGKGTSSSEQPPKTVLESPLAPARGELEDFYRLFFLPLVRRGVRKHRLSFEDAGDIVQDAFVLAVGKLDPARNPKAWLYQVVDHLAVNFQRKTIRRAKLVARWQPPSLSEQGVREASDEY